TRGTRRYDYRIILEPTGQRWLMTIPAADVRLTRARVTRLLTHENKDVIDTALAYDVTSFPDFQYQAEGLTARERYLYLQLPVAGNDVTRRHGRELFRQSGQSPQRMIDSILHWFREEEFFYTLK